LTCSYSQVSNLAPLAGLVALQRLDCSRTQVSDLAPLSGLVALQQLSCSYTRGVSDLAPLSGLTALQQLDCGGTQVSDLAPLSGLTGLQRLDCSSTQVSDLAPLSGLTALQRLDCGYTQVGDLAPLSGLTALQRLDCGYTQVGDLAPLSGLTALQRLNCNSTEVSDLAPLSGLTALQQLDCNRTQVSDLAPLSGLTALQQLSCSYTQVSDLAPLSGLTALQQLVCVGTQVSDLAPLSCLVALQELDCSRTQVSDLAPLSGLTALQQLVCSDTQVSDLAPLSGLTALQQLDCSFTQVSDLAPLSGLVALEYLDCSYCRLRALPATLRNSQALHELIAHECHVSGTPAGVLSQHFGENCLGSLRAHFADLASGVEDVIDVKLLLLGNGGVGKTQIARFLAGAAFDTRWDSTHGIQVVAGATPDSVAARLHLQIWDFGGQDIYHGTHVLFLRSPAVVMPVWAKTRENRDGYELNGLSFRNHPLNYWTDVVRHQASEDSPVLIVQSQCDTKDDEARRFPVDDETLNALPYAAELRVSIKEKRGTGALEEDLRDAIAWLRKRTGVAQIGAVRLRVQRRLEALRDADMALPRAQRRHRLLDRSDFDTICEEEGGVSSPDMLLAYLDAIGTIIYRKGLFRGRIVLDQGWALDAIYAVFDRKQVYQELRRQHGRFTRTLLAMLVWQDKSDAEQELLLGMMQSCGMCFRHRRFDGSNDEYIAPDLLPDRDAVAATLAARWRDDAPGETAVFCYGLLHGGLIRQIMSAIGEIAGVDALYWRGGLCTYEAETRSRLRIDEEMTGAWDGLIRVQTQGGQAAALLQKIIPLIEKAQAQIGLKPISVERSSPERERQPQETKLSFRQEKPDVPEWYVSYAWGDGTPEGRKREAIVDRLCAAATARKLVIQRDKNVLGPGDSVSAFMKRIGAGDRVFVILSEKYLRSEFCMFELSEIWDASRRNSDDFRRRVRVYVADDVKVWKPGDRREWAKHWKREYEAAKSFAQTEGSETLGIEGQRQLLHMHRFYTEVYDILFTLADIVQPRSFEDLERYGFADL
jgi:internalin A